ncbi:MAG: glycosyltransferase [Synergistaceae bacterium]|nr:glycosyltransferase [Synergistaceae bacterium]
MFRVVKELQQLEKDISPDIIHLHSSIAGFFGRIAFNGRNNTVIYTPHGYAHVLSGPCVKSRIYRFVEKLLGYRNCITLTCCASEDEEAKTLTSRTAYIETGLNISELSRTLSNIQPTKHERFTVFSLGRIVRQKRPDVFNKIAELVPEAKFIWIGGGPLSYELTAPNIEITGWMPREEALAIAKGADAFVLCSYGEAIAMSLLENMYLEKLTLVSNTMGNKSVIHNGVNGWLCDTPEDYAEKIRSAMSDFPIHLTQSARQSIDNIYNMEAMKRKFIAYYNSLP